VQWSSADYSPRRKLVAGLLGIFLGSLGVHRFYLGFVGLGIVQIIVTLMTGGIGGIWGFIEGILCLTGNLHDVEGRPLRD
jgi:TM2 domain-containing membrane protein YozV